MTYQESDSIQEKHGNHHPPRFLRCLYPVPFAELGGRPDDPESPTPLPRIPWLAVWSKSIDGRHLVTDWCPDLEAAVAAAERRKATSDVYFGAALQDREAALEIARRGRGGREPDPATVRGGSATAAVLPGAWIDLDVRGPGHKRSDLPPDRAAALELLEAVHLPPTCIVATGGGYHVYWCLRHLWALVTDADRTAAAWFLKQVLGPIQEAARERGWKLDAVTDPARVMRLPGTFNHKRCGAGDGPRPVVVELFEPERRYDLADFSELPEPAADPVRPRPPARAPKRRGQRTRVWKPANFVWVFRGCSWIRHCWEERRTLGEPEWYAMLTIAGHCHVPEVSPREKTPREGPLTSPANGRQLAHRMSRGYPDYSEAKTDKKLRHALKEPNGPRSCHEIGDAGARAEHCDRCPSRGPDLTTPILLGRRSWWRRRRRKKKNPPSIPPSRAATFSKGGRSARASEASDSHPSAPGSDDRRSSKQPILLSHHEERVADAALAALVARERNLFQRGGALVQVVAADDERPYHRPPGAPGAHPVGEARLREILVSHCEPRRPHETGAGVDWRPAHPPQWLVRALLGRFRWRGVPTLEGIVEGPVLRRDGTVLQKTGYDPASGLYCAPAERPDPVPETPGRGAADAALGLLREAVCDFPFQSETHFAGWVASLLTPLARYAFKGPAPLNLIDANVRGAGKTLLADVTHLIVTGRPASHMAYLRDEVELRKAITSIALKGRQMVLFDNVAGAFGSPTLDLVLTSALWQDRLLGQNLDLELPLLVTWYVTGNNIDLKGDLGRRCVHIRLESPAEKPEHRQGFRHPRLLEWIEGERRRLLPAAVTLLAAYCADGAPDLGLRPWGAYESWSSLVRGTIVWLGLPDPIETCEGLESTADAELLASQNLVRGLAELVAALGRGATAGEILEELEAGRKEDRYETLQAAVEELFPRLKRGELPTPVRLGHKLRSLRGRNFGGRAIEGGRGNRGVVWTVERLQTSPPAPQGALPQQLPFDDEDEKEEEDEK